MRALLLIASLSFAAPAFAQDAMSFDDSPQMLSGETANQSVTPDRPVIQTGGAAAEGPKYRVAKELDDKVREFASRRQFPQAIADFDEALRRDGKYAFAHYNKGIAYALQNKHDDAIASFTSAIAINDKYTEAYAQRGKARVAKGDVPGGRADFAKALAQPGRS